MSHLFKYQTVVILFIVIFAVSDLAGRGTASEILGVDSEITYRETTGDDEKFFSWQVTPQGDKLIVSLWEDDDSRYENVCTKSGETLEWRYFNGENTKLHAVRKGNQLLITGIMNGEAVDKVKEIDERPWYQPLSFSLRAFLDSNEETTSFWTIRANTLDVYPLKAKKVSREEIATVSGQEMTRKVEMRVEGLLAKFWRGTYWYRESDGLFLRYKSVHGPLGTDPTVITLISPHDQQSVN